MDEMWWFMTGAVVGGLALWLFMRERINKLQAELAERSSGKSDTTEVLDSSNLGEP